MPLKDASSPGPPWMPSLPGPPPRHPAAPLTPPPPAVAAIFPLHAPQSRIVARPAVDDVVARSPHDHVSTAKAAYLVIAFLAGQQVVSSVGAQEPAAPWGSG